MSKVLYLVFHYMHGQKGLWRSVTNLSPEFKSRLTPMVGWEFMQIEMIDSERVNMDVSAVGSPI